VCVYVRVRVCVCVCVRVRACACIRMIAFINCHHVHMSVLKSKLDNG